LRGTDLKIKIIRVCSDSDHRKRGKSFAWWKKKLRHNQKMLKWSNYCNKITTHTF
jgi:hypothetical protein